MTFVAHLLAAMAATCLAASAGCMRPKPADEVPPSMSVRTTSAVVARGAPAVPEWRVVANVTSHAIAADAGHLYFGDDQNGGLYVAPKIGGPPVALGTPAPLAIALVDDSIVWIAAPGNVVKSAARIGGPAFIVRAGGAFTAVAASGRDVFVAEKVSGGGTLTRITGSTATQIASFPAVPRALAVDAESVFVEMAPALVRVSRRTGEVTQIATGRGFSQLASDADSLYVTEPDIPSRALVRITKTGSTRSVLDRGVRDGPIAVSEGWVYYLQELDQPRLRRVASAGGASAFVAEAPSLRRVNAMTADASGIYVASADGPAGPAVIEMPIIELPAESTPRTGAAP